MTSAQEAKFLPQQFCTCPEVPFVLLSKHFLDPSLNDFFNGWDEEWQAGKVTMQNKSVRTACARQWLLRQRQVNKQVQKQVKVPCFIPSSQACLSHAFVSCFCHMPKGVGPYESLPQWLKRKAFTQRLNHNYGTVHLWSKRAKLPVLSGWKGRHSCSPLH